eukprot:PhM_4_TR8881/c0_g1_i1/m.100896/K06027/NSF, SEC18; vesicle-fusing ATPase
MSTSSLKVVSTPTDAMTLTNLVYVPPGTVPGSGKFIEVAGFVFAVQEDALVQPGGIAFNARQRNCARLSTTMDSVQPYEFRASSVPILSLVKFEAEPATKVAGGAMSIDASIFTDSLLKCFAGQIITMSQSILTIYQGKKVVLTVRAVEQQEADGSKAAKISRGFLGPNTTVLFSKGENSPISFTNLPEGTEQGNAELFPEGFNFESTGIGGLGKQLEEIFRRAFESRLYPRSIVRKMRTRHVKGVLLYGPPGTGKTLIARRLSSMLGCKNLRFVNGPELFDKYVGQTEANIRELFSAAEAESKSKGEDSSLHIIVFDEFDSMVKQRGSTRDNTGVHDSAVNQLLSKIDGPEELNNILLIAMTNRKDLIDEAVLRPGRFEVHIEIPVPTEQGRLEIFQIKTEHMMANGVLGADVDLHRLASLTKNFTGAEIEGVVNNASSYAMHRHVDMKNPTVFKNPEQLKIRHEDFESAIGEFKPALGVATDELEFLTRNGILDYGIMWQELMSSSMSYVETIRHSTRLSCITLLLEGQHGVGKSALAAHIARLSEFPYVKVVKPETYVGYMELSKCNAIRQAFQDADRSPFSVVIVDDIERLIEYVELGARFSNAVLQTLLVMIKRQPPPGKKLLVIGTTSKPELLETLEITQAFNATKTVLPLGRDEALEVMDLLKVKFASETERSKAREALPRDIPVKRLMLVVERALGLAASNDGPNNGLTADDIVNALN